MMVGSVFDAEVYDDEFDSMLSGSNSSSYTSASMTLPTIILCAQLN